MMNIKKILSILTTTALCAFIAGCGDDEPTEKQMKKLEAQFDKEEAKVAKTESEIKAQQNQAVLDNASLGKDEAQVEALYGKGTFNSGIVRNESCNRPAYEYRAGNWFISIAFDDATKKSVMQLMTTHEKPSEEEVAALLKVAGGGKNWVLKDKASSGIDKSWFYGYVGTLGIADPNSNWTNVFDEKDFKVWELEDGSQYAIVYYYGDANGESAGKFQALALMTKEYAAIDWDKKRLEEYESK